MRIHISGLVVELARAMTQLMNSDPWTFEHSWPVDYGAKQ
jgi:hypothetical protein